MNEGSAKGPSVRALLASPTPASSWWPGPLERRAEALRFHAVLGERGCSVTRWWSPRPAATGRLGGGRAGGSSGALRSKTSRTLEEARALATRDASGVAALRAGTAPVPLLAVPRYSSEVHDLRALWRAGSHLIEDATAPDTEAIL